MRHTLPFEICTILPFYLNWINDIFENISDKYKEISIFKKNEMYSVLIVFFINIMTIHIYRMQYNNLVYTCVAIESALQLP